MISVNELRKFQSAISDIHTLQSAIFRVNRVGDDQSWRPANPERSPLLHGHTRPLKKKRNLQVKPQTDPPVQSDLERPGKRETRRHSVRSQHPPDPPKCQFRPDWRRLDDFVHQTLIFPTLDFVFDSKTKLMNVQVYSQFD